MPYVPGSHEVLHLSPFHPAVQLHVPLKRLHVAPLSHVQTLAQFTPNLSLLHSVRQCGPVHPSGQLHCSGPTHVPPLVTQSESHS
jgi:hypothetical protein